MKIAYDITDFHMKMIKIKANLFVDETSFAFKKNEATELIVKRVMRITMNAIYWQIYEPVYHSAVFGW